MPTTEPDALAKSFRSLPPERRARTRFLRSDVFPKSATFLCTLPDLRPSAAVCFRGERADPEDKPRPKTTVVHVESRTHNG